MKRVSLLFVAVALCAALQAGDVFNNDAKAVKEGGYQYITTVPLVNSTGGAYVSLSYVTGVTRGFDPVTVTPYVDFQILIMNQGAGTQSFLPVSGSPVATWVQGVPMAASATVQVSGLKWFTRIFYKHSATGTSGEMSLYGR